MRCPRCERDCRPDARFCDGCGAALESAPAAPEGAYTPRHVRDRILRTRGAVEGERKQVTVLFLDIQGSMALSERIDPEDWHRILDRFFAIVADGIHRFDGTVNQYTGDGVMALFGAPLAHEDHAQRACYAALHLGQRLRRYGQKIKRERGLGFSVRMGLNSGEVIVGRIGDDLRMDYTAQGHTVGLAARMQELASPDTVYLSQHTADLAAGFFELEDLGPFRVRGASEEIRVHQLLGPGVLRTRLDRARARGFSRFVGRADELKLLGDALERAVGGDGQVVAVRGEPGVGKSRLCLELIERCRKRQIPVREAHGVSHGRMIPFLPVRELMSGYFGIEDGDADETARDKIAGRVVRLDPELAESLPLLFDFFGVPDPEPGAHAGSAEVREKRLFEIIRRLVHARSQREPALIVVEDLQWMDGASERFVENLADSVPGTCTLLVVNHRPEYRSEWPSRARQIDLQPLGPAETDELLADILGDDASLAGLRPRIRERTEGNPFFVEELVQSLVESGHLEGRRGAYRLTQPPHALAIAPTVKAVLSARIDRLPEREKQLLHTASVIGRNVPGSVLARVAGFQEAELAAATRGLLDTGFLYEESLFPETEYAFKHPLTHEVAYSTQLAGRRQRVHAAVAGAVEALHPDKLDDRAALLAHHWEQAREPLRAAHWHRRAALHVGANHFPEAVRHWSRVRGLLGQAPESEEALAMGVEARGQLIVAAGRLGQAPDTVDDMFDEARRLAERSRDASVLNRVLLLYSYSKAISGDLEEAQPWFVEARRRIDASDDAHLRAAALYLPVATRIVGTGWCRDLGPAVDEALAFARREPDLGAPVLGFPAWQVLRSLRAQLRAFSGRLDRHLPELQGTARDRGAHPASQLMASFFGAHVAERMGEPAHALDLARRATEVAEQMGFGESYAKLSLGRALLASAAWDEAAGVLAEGFSDLRRRRVYGYLLPAFHAALARAQLGRGDVAAARETCEAALALAPGGSLFAADAHQVLARARIRAEGASAREEIETLLQAARRLGDACGVLCVAPAVAEAAAELARAGRDEEAAARALVAAYRGYQEVGASGHATRLAAQSM
jgi:class 3 adenylate cyclase